MMKSVERLLHISGFYSSLRAIYRQMRYILTSWHILPFRIAYIVVSVGQACNYKCRDCGNFAPYAPAKFMRYSFEDLRKWITQLAQSVDGINTVQIQGGEPFLYSDLGKLILLLRELRTDVGEVITDISIATNGSVLPKDELIAIMKSAGVNVRISDYNIMPQKTQNLITLLQEHKIPFQTYRFAGKNGRWFRCGGVNICEYSATDEDAVRERYESCAFRGCLTLERGQLARCSRGNDAPEIQDFSSKTGDYIVLSDYETPKKLRSAFMKYYYFPRYMEACKYCNGTKQTNMVDAAIQI